jgi:hypothetical protein
MTAKKAQIKEHSSNYQKKRPQAMTDGQLSKSGQKQKYAYDHEYYTRDKSTAENLFGFFHGQIMPLLNWFLQDIFYYS